MDSLVKRWNLTRADVPVLVMSALIIGFLFLLYFEFGQIYHRDGDTKSALGWMIVRWRTGERTYGHIYKIFSLLIPAISLWTLWRRRHELRAARKRAFWSAWVLIAGCLFAHWAGVVTEHPRLCLVSLIAIFWSIPLFLYGAQVARWLIFPCVYLVFLIPLNFLDGFVFKVRLLVSQTAAAIMNGLGMECAVRGTDIVSLNGSYVIELQSTASGLGVVLLCLAVASAVGNLTQRSWVYQWSVFFSAIPAYFFASTIIMVLFGFVAGAIGQDPVTWMASYVLVPLVSLMSLTFIAVVATVFRRFGPLGVLRSRLRILTRHPG